MMTYRFSYRLQSSAVLIVATITLLVPPLTFPFLPSALFPRTPLSYPHGTPRSPPQHPSFFARADTGPNATLKAGARCLGYTLWDRDQGASKNPGPFCGSGLHCVFFNGIPAKKQRNVHGIGRCVPEGRTCPENVTSIKCVSDCMGMDYVQGPDCDSIMEKWVCYADVCDQCWRKMFYSDYHWPIQEASMCERTQGPPYPCLSAAQLNASCPACLSYKLPTRTCFVPDSYCPNRGCAKSYCLKVYRKGWTICGKCAAGYKKCPTPPVALPCPACRAALLAARCPALPIAPPCLSRAALPCSSRCPDSARGHLAKDRARSLPPLLPSPAPPCLPCVEGRQHAARHSSSFPLTSAPLQTLHMDVWGPARVSGQGCEGYFLLRFHKDLPVLRLHFDRGGEFSSDFSRDLCRGEGILQSFTLPASPQQNGIAERRIGLVMELNLWPRVSLPETSHKLHWTGKIGDASVFQVWGSRAFVRDTSADKLSSRAIHCVFLGFPPDAPGWQFYHPTSRHVLPSQDVTFDESIPFYRTAPQPPHRSSSLQVTVDSGVTGGGAARGAASGGAELVGAEPGGAEPASAEPGGAEPEGAETGGAESEGVETGGAEPRGTASAGGSAGAGGSAAGGTGAGGTGGAGAGGNGDGNPSDESTATSALVAELVDFAAACCLDYAASLVAESESDCPPSIGGECALGKDVLEDRQEDFECLAAAVPHLVAMLLAPEGDPDAPDIPTPRSYEEAITVPPPGAKIVDGMWIFRVKRPPGSRPVFKAPYVARGFIYGLRQAPREWHDTLRMTLAALGFAPSTADPSLFLRTDTTLPSFYVLVYVDDLVFATADTEALAHVKSELQKRHTCTDLGELRSYLGLQITRDRARHTITLTQSHMVHQILQRFGFQCSSPQFTPLPTGHSLSAPPSDESIEPSGPYPELVGCLMYLMTCSRPDLAHPLSILARYVPPRRHRPEQWEAA
ncbi:unnamed protein product [Closterium sp. NIES-54]